MNVILSNPVIIVVYFLANAYIFGHVECAMVTRRSDFRLVGLLGEGVQSRVYLVKRPGQEGNLAVKIPKNYNDTDSIKDINHEIDMLIRLDNGPNVIRLEGIIRHKKSKARLVVLEYINQTSLVALANILTESDVRNYTYQLLRAVNHSHAMGVINRDLKPKNILINHESRTLRVADFGRAIVYNASSPPEKPGSGTPFFMAPEQILRYARDVSFPVDVWGTACVFAGMLFRVERLFQGKHKETQLVKVAEILGTDDLFKYMNDRNISLKADVRYWLKEGKRKRPWGELVNQGNRDLVSPEAFDLLDRMFTYDPRKRITAREALGHPYFRALVLGGEAPAGSRSGSRLGQGAGGLAPASKATTAAKSVGKVDAGLGKRQRPTGQGPGLRWGG